MLSETLAKSVQELWASKNVERIISKKAIIVGISPRPTIS